MSFRDTFPDIPAILSEIRRRPVMYIERKSTRYLRCFLTGFECAEHFYDIEPNSRSRGLDWVAFESWVENKYNPRRLTVQSFGMAEIIAGDEERGLDLWFQWYDEFRKEHPTASP